MRPLPDRPVPPEPQEARDLPEPQAQKDRLVLPVRRVKPDPLDRLEFRETSALQDLREAPEPAFKS